MTTPAYITVTDLQRFFSAQEIAKLQGATNGAEADALVEVANAEADSYLAGLRGTARLVSVPVAVKMKVADIARFYFYKDSASELITKRWEAANAYFLAVAKGQIPLALDLADNPDTPQDDVADAGGVWSQPGTALGYDEWKFI